MIKSNLLAWHLNRKDGSVRANQHNERTVQYSFKQIRRSCITDLVFDMTNHGRIIVRRSVSGNGCKATADSVPTGMFG